MDAPPSPYTRALQGDGDAASAAGSDAERAAAQAALWFHAAPAGRLPTLEELEARVGTGTAELGHWAIVGSAIARAAHLVRDSSVEVRAAVRAAQLAAGTTDERAQIAAELAGERCAIATQGRVALERVAVLEDLARRAHLPDLVVESAVVAALGALGAGDVAGALRQARRASRIARTEAIPLAEYDAHRALAQIRRRTGHPHLATRIVASVQRLAATPFSAALAWEMALAGGGATQASAEPRPETWAGLEPRLFRAIAALSRASVALAANDPAAFDDACAAAVAALPADCPERAELDVLRACLDLRVDLGAATGESAAFTRGEVDEVPRGFHGFAATLGDAESAIAYAVHDGRSARRCLAPGARLVGPLVVVADNEGKRTSRRLETATAVLALAREPLDIGELFRRVYGFPYIQRLHGNTLKVLLHRLRAALGDAAELRRDDQHISLNVKQPFMVADPRCGRPLADSVLIFIGRHPHATAKEIAEAMGMPLRTAQAALKELVEEGACSVERRGSLVAYRIEDTTYAEPTAY